MVVECAGMRGSRAPVWVSGSGCCAVVLFCCAVLLCGAVWVLLVEGVDDLGGRAFVGGEGVGVGRDLYGLGGVGQRHGVPAGDAGEGLQEQVGRRFGVHQVLGVAPVGALLEQSDAVVVRALAVVGVVVGVGDGGGGQVVQ